MEKIGYPNPRLKVGGLILMTSIDIKPKEASIHRRIAGVKIRKVWSFEGSFLRLKAKYTKRAGIIEGPKNAMLPPQKSTLGG